MEPAVYTVDVFTGDVRGAGSPMPAELQLIGTAGVSEPFVFGDDPDSPGFARGSHHTLQVEAPADLGDLLRVVVKQHKPGDSDVGVGWFLDTVEVSGPGENTWRFPCSHWLGKSDAGDYVGETVRNLIPTHAEAEHIAEYLAEPLEVLTASMVVPHPEKVTPNSKARIHRDFGYGGEDAYYCAWGPRNAVLGLGVADGVYMWRSRGIDSGVFSRSLMLSAKNAVEYGQVDVLNVLKDAADTVEENSIQGSSTCCLVLVDTLQGRLTSANIGDSGFLLIGSTPANRKPHVKFHSPQQEHTFGFPYQLGHQVNADKPHDAMLANIPLLPGDVLVMGSDGLWDNVSDNEILDLVLTVNAEQAGPRPMAVAQGLARAAFYNSLDKKRVTPYSLGATEAFDMVFNGGKQDDITVVVATFSGELIPGRLEGVGRHGL